MTLCDTLWLKCHKAMCLGVRDGAAETLLTGVKVVPETMYLGKSSIGGDIAHIGDWFVFSCVYYIIRFIGISSSTSRRSMIYRSRNCTVMHRCSLTAWPARAHNDLRGAAPVLGS